MNRPLKVGKPLSRWAGLAIGTTAKAKKKAVKASEPEAVIQAQVEAYCALVGLECFHVPEYVLNAAFGWKSNRTGPELGAMADAAEEIRGLPDCLIFNPMRHGLVLPGEIKTEIGVVSKAQAKWRKILGTRIWRSFEEARIDIDQWRKA